ncbi:MAG: hypothetical protein ACRDZR_06720 [Acidimicrobiales bacterium]
MASSVAQALRLLEQRASADAELAEALLYLADEVAGPEDPFARPSSGVLAAARRVTERRAADSAEARRTDALDTAAVVASIASVHDRRGVDRRRRRGQLLGWSHGSSTLHPAWQFDRSRGDTWPGLPKVIGALAEVAPDARAADALMRAPREDLGGHSLADLLAVGQVETIVRLVQASTDQS